MDFDALRGSARSARNRWRKLMSLARPYSPMPHGEALLNTQYAQAEWDYLRSVEEAPRFGILSSYCQMFALNGSLLEIGCGDALLLEHLDRKKYSHFTGVDISAVAIERTQPLWDNSTTFICADAERVTFDSSFDLILFNEVLEYFADPLAVVRRFEPFARPGAHFAVSMFAGLDTSRARQIWRMLESRYTPVAQSRIETRRNYLWKIKVYLVAPEA